MSVTFPHKNSPDLNIHQSNAWYFSSKRIKWLHLTPVSNRDLQGDKGVDRRGVRVSTFCHSCRFQCQLFKQSNVKLSKPDQKSAEPSRVVRNDFLTNDHTLWYFWFSGRVPACPTTSSTIIQNFERWFLPNQTPWLISDEFWWSQLRTISSLE